MNEIVVVTVTYGRRAHLLSVSLASAVAQGCNHIVLVNNGSNDPVAALIENQFAAKNVHVVNFEANLGSATGFSEGLKAAFALGFEYILLLDDDNILEAGALKALKDGWAAHAKSIDSDNLVVLGYRPEHQADVAAGVSVSRLNQHPNSFFGFHIEDIPFKVSRRTSWYRRKHITDRYPAEILITVAPYSGMYFHRSLLEKHGYPNPDFILYADDTEFSYRVTRSGGKIILLTNARFHDLESSWNVKKRFSSTFQMWLHGEGDRKVYYSMRNQAYFEKHCRLHQSIIRWLNRLIFLAAIRIMAKRDGRNERLALITQAIQDGENARLGLNPTHPL